MPISSEPISRCVALIGNPNTGKSTLFSAIVGIHQRVGNYPGVTVEKKTGQIEYGGCRYTFVDLPGLYSLAPQSRDEMVSVDVLLGRQSDLDSPDAVVCVVDASNLQRNLYLVSQVLEMGLPTVVALTMLDVAADHGISIDLAKLEQQLGVPVVAMQAHRRVGLGELKEAIAKVSGGVRPPFPSLFPPAFDEELAHFESYLAEHAALVASTDLLRPSSRWATVWRWLRGSCEGNTCGPRHCSNRGTGTRRSAPLPRPLVQRLLLDTSGRIESLLFPHGDRSFRVELQAARNRLAATGCRVPEIETTVRYRWAQNVLEGVVSQPRHFAATVSDRVDRLLTHRVFGTIIFGVVMVVMFQAVFVWAEPLMNAIRGATGWLGGLIQTGMAEGALRSLLVDGMIAGVGGILQFLPQILILFLFLAVLEDCGYMARAAYLMDGLMVRVGLSGKSFIPLLSSFACAIPGIMAARVIENERDRLTTILVAPLMTCSARLPVYALLISAFIPPVAFLGGLLTLQGLTLAALYLLGILAAVAAARLFKKTVLRAETPPFVMELPSYKWPSPRTVAMRVVERAFSFVRFAGTTILAVSILVWAALYYPHDSDAIDPDLRERQERVQSRVADMEEGSAERAELSGTLNELDTQIAGAYQRQSYLGRFGHMIEPAFRPLGWDWRIGSAVIASFPAREVVVSTMGVIFNLGDVEAENGGSSSSPHAKLREATWEGSDRALFNIPVALSLMVFYALCAQCVATLAVIRHETNSWRWPAFTFAYMTTLAYLGALATYRIGMWIGGG